MSKKLTGRALADFEAGRDIWQEALDGAREIKAGGGRRVEERPLDTQNPDWSPGFFEQLRAVDSETVAAVDDLLASVRQARTSKAARSL
jgi:hypothetical protein